MAYRVVNHEDIITFDQRRRSGKPCIRDTRMTVFDIFEYLAGGMTHEELLGDFPELAMDDILACYDYVSDENVIPRVPPHK